MNMQYMQPTDESKREILALLEQVRSDVRCISHELMPPKFQVTTLAETVEAYVEGLALPASVQLAFSKENEEIQWSQVPEEVSYEVYRIMQVKTTVVTRCGERASGLPPFKNVPKPSVVCLPRIFRTEAKSSSLKYRYPFNGKPVCRRVKSLFLMMPHIDKCYFFAT